MKKLSVNQDACIGCGACVSIDEEHFQFDDNGLSKVISQENLDKSDINMAIDACPTSAISLSDSDCECKKNGNECHCHEA